MLPQLRRLEARFPDTLVVIGVHSAKFPAERESGNLRAAVDRLELHHTVVNDAAFRVWQGFAVRAWPTLMFVDPDGRVFGKHEGELAEEPVAAMVEEALAGYADTGRIDSRPIPLTPLASHGDTLRYPEKVLADPSGECLFIADTGHHRILSTDLGGRTIAVFGDGIAALRDGDAGTAQFNQPRGLALRSGALFVADTGNHALRHVDLDSGMVTTVAGTGALGRTRQPGPPRGTALRSPWDLAWVGDELWIAMAGSHQLWALDPATRALRVAAGTGVESIHDGPLAEATFAQPSGLTMIDDALYLADAETSSIRRVDLQTARVRRLVGRGLFDFGDQDGRGDEVRLQHPLGVAARREGDEIAIYIADSYNDKIKRLNPATREVETIAGGRRGHEDALATDAAFWEPSSLSLDGDALYIADTNNHAIRRLSLLDFSVSTLDVRDDA
ncbi:MAG: alkyl hydroperoxide reductase [Chloroflexia bacterium]|nr:alkyl hydroperoxide reductase [Chloroflexia bacterium]